MEKKAMLERIKAAQKLVRTAVFLLIVVASVVLTVWLAPKVLTLSTPEGRTTLEEQLRSYGVGGWLAFLGIQVLQVIVAMIPGEPVEILSGVLYGAVGGAVTCMLGVFIGSILVFFLVKKLGMPLVTTFIDEEKIRRLWFLRDEKRFETLAFILFFIPGTPKDLLTWAVGLTNIKPARFFLIASVARTPSILSSTLVGASLIKGDFTSSAIIFLVTGLVSVAGVLIHRLIVSYRDKLSKEDD